MVITESPRQGEIWWAEAEDKRRPVLIITRTFATSRLNRIIVAPVTKTVRGIPTEIPLGAEHGLAYESAATFDNLHPIALGALTERIGRLEMANEFICRALSAMADC